MRLLRADRDPSGLDDGVAYTVDLALGPLARALHRKLACCLSGLDGRVRIGNELIELGRNAAHCRAIACSRGAAIFAKSVAGAGREWARHRDDGLGGRRHRRHRGG